MYFDFSVNAKAIPFIHLLMLAFFSGEKPVLSPARPKCNSILHLYGKWLFEAAYIGTDFGSSAAALGGGGGPPNTAHGGGGSQAGRRPTSLQIDAEAKFQQQAQQQQQATTPTSRKMSVSSSTVMSHSTGPMSSSSTATTDSSLELPAALTPERFESGRAEAVGALCR